MATIVKTTNELGRMPSVKQARSSQEDLDWVRLAASGDETAFRRLVEIYTPRVFSLVSGMIADRSETEDIVQEVFFKVHRKIHSFEGKSAFYTWLYRVSLNTASDHLKKRRNRQSKSLEELPGFDVQDECDDPDTRISRDELRKALAQAVSELPDKYRDVLVLREYEQRSYEEISEILECSKGTVESRLFRARGRLREKMTPFLR